MQAGSDHSACSCCASFFRPGGLRRRGFMAGMAGALAAPMVFTPARAEDGTAYEAMLLTCIDPRFVTPVFGWMEAKGLKGRYSQFAIAGSAVGVVAPAFAAWQPAFWDNLGASIQLHKITRVIVMNHRDCGAAAIAYGADAIGTPAAENNLHQTVYESFKGQLATRQPRMRVEGGLMALDGSVMALG